MKIEILVKFCFFILYQTIVPAQNQLVDFSQNVFDAYNIDSKVYNFWFYQNDWHKIRSFKHLDTTPYFVDERTYRGILNYGIQYYRLDKLNIHSNENYRMYELNISINKLTFYPKDSTVNIQGSVTGGWSKRDCIYYLNDKLGWVEDNNVNVYIGKRNYTRSKLYYVPDLMINYPEKYKITYKGSDIKNKVVLDTFPSFYLSDYAHYKTNKGNDRTFNLTTKINPSTIIAFGLTNCYSKIYEIGKLAFDSEVTRNLRFKENNKKSWKTEPNENNPEYIIRNNVQELYRDTITEPEKTAYFKVIETAESFIVNNQYGKAKDEYVKLLKNGNYIFARDLHNALRTAILSRDYQTALLYSEKLVLKGIPLSYFDAEIFSKLKNTVYWKGFLMRYKELNHQYKKSTNQNLIAKLAELVAIDQKDYEKHARGELESANLFDTTVRVNDMLLELIRQEGFPTEEKIGVKMQNDSMPKFRAEYEVLIAHSHQADIPRLDELKNIIDENTVKGLYDSTRSNLTEFMNMGTCLMLYKGDLYHDKSCGAVNKKQLGLIDFSFNNKHGFIIDEGEFAILGYNKAHELEDKKFLEEGFNFVKKITDDWFEDEF